MTIIDSNKDGTAVSNLVTDKDKNGNTVLHYAAMYGLPEMIRILVVDHKALNAEGKRAEQIADDTLPPHVLDLLEPREKEGVKRFFHIKKEVATPAQINEKMTKKINTFFQGESSSIISCVNVDNSVLNRDVVNLIVEYAITGPRPVSS